MPEQQRVPGWLAATKVHMMQLPDRKGELVFSDEVERAGGDQQMTEAAFDEDANASRYVMALASHDPSFSPGVPVSPFDEAGSAHEGV